MPPPPGYGSTSYEDYQQKMRQQQDQMAGRTGTQGNYYDDSSRGFQAAFGGPIGWYEAATGRKNDLENWTRNNIFGQYDYSGAMNDKDVYESMNEDDWKSFNRSNAEEQAAFVKQRKSEIAPQLAAKQKAAEAEAARQKNEAERGQFQTDMIKRLDSFAKEMGMSVDQLMQTDSYAKALSQQTYANSAQSAYGSGLGYGGISAMNADQTTKNALLGYQMQRQQAGAAATQNAFGMMETMGQDAENRRRYEQGLDLQLQGAQQQAQMANYQQQQQQKAGLYSLAGGVIGGMYGGPTGAAFGSQLGGGLAGATSTPYQARGFNYPSNTGNYGSYGSGGGVGGGGGYKPMG